MHGAQGPRPIISRWPLPQAGEARLCGPAAVTGGGALGVGDAGGAWVQPRAAATGMAVTREGSLGGGGGRSKPASPGADAPGPDAPGAGAPDGAPPPSPLVALSSAPPAPSAVPAALAAGDAEGA